MRKFWWKYLAIFLILYSLTGGLLMPLKTGVLSVSPLSVESISPVSVKIKIYNAGKNFNAEKVCLRFKDSLFFNATQSSFDAQKEELSASFNIKLGKEAPKSEMYDLFVYSGNNWMSFPSALSIKKSSSDTALHNAEVLHNLKQDKSLFKGFPNRPILNESVRNLLYHVPMWFSMIALLFISAFYSVKYLLKMNGNLNVQGYDRLAASFTRVAMLCGLLGCITGAVWAKITWGAYWPRDPKLNGVAIGMLLYGAYFVVRAGIKDAYQKARISAVYNVFIFPVFIALILIMPKLSQTTLHPGSGGSVGFNKYDLDSTLRLFFYPACAGWILLMAWIATLDFRIKQLTDEQENAQ